ncbi:protein PAT1 homolog isoform X2 [Andrographis paniculata]|nr:protein PAT1 homolog isoform X2 [Andrographis paniculata]
MVEEGELGGLADEDDDFDAGGYEKELQLEREELNKVTYGLSITGAGRDRGSRESSSAADLAQAGDFPNCFDHGAFDAEINQESENWTFHSYSTSSNSHPQFNALPRGPQFGGNLSQLPHRLPNNSQLSCRWVNQSGLNPGNHSGLSKIFFSLQSGRMPPLVMPPAQHSQQARLQHPFQPPALSNAARPPPQLLGRQLSRSLPMMSSFDVLGSPDSRDQRALQLQRSRHGQHHHSYTGQDSAGQKGVNGWPRFRARYMSPAEIENILRMQLAATHSINPYIDDYYHQACLARKSSGARLRHHFCPIFLRDSSSKPRGNNEPHNFLQVDALGRVAFPSIRRPRPLLEVDSPIGPKPKHTEKPLEQEPMLAARITIEDGLSLLLDVDDIDRFLQFYQLEDGGTQLRQKRQTLLEGLASSLHLVDPLEKHGKLVKLAPKDEIIFLRIVSLPKGQKLLLRYLQLLLPSELTRVVCMAIFRSLRFLFGNIPTDPKASMVIVNLAKAVSSCVHSMELKALAACLASVACSNEQTPTCPIVNPAGDGASLVLKSVLDRATELLTDPKTAGNCTAQHREFWQASFDAFFGLLTKYCFNKYESVVQSFVAPGLSESAPIGSDMVKAFTREMPIELLRSSLPHTNEQQRKVLQEFGQRSMPVLGGGNGSS